MAGWIGITSSHYVSHCGDNESQTLEEALAGTDYWQHAVEETHWFIIDLGTTYTVSKVRGRSLFTADPTDVNIYVNATGSAPWSSAVATGISTWQDRADWDGNAVIETTPKEGRYIKVDIIDTENVSKSLQFGHTGPGYVKIFDVYGEAGAVSGAVSPLINSGIMNSLLLNGGLIG